MNAPWTITDTLTILGLGVLCLPILLVLMPYVEASRSEARIGKAYEDVRLIHEALTDAEPPQESLPETDPWGQPYRIVRLDDGKLRALSSGPNESTTPGRIDGDNVYSDMPVSPLEPIHARKHRQALLALAATTGAWGLLGWFYARSRREKRGTRVLSF